MASRIDPVALRSAVEVERLTNQECASRFATNLSAVKRAITANDMIADFRNNTRWHTVGRALFDGHMRSRTPPVYLSKGRIDQALRRTNPERSFRQPHPHPRLRTTFVSKGPGEVYCGDGNEPRRGQLPGASSFSQWRCVAALCGRWGGDVGAMGGPSRNPLRHATAKVISLF